MITWRAHFFQILCETPDNAVWRS